MTFTALPLTPSTSFQHAGSFAAVGCSASMPTRPADSRKARPVAAGSPAVSRSSNSGMCMASASVVGGLTTKAPRPGYIATPTLRRHAVRGGG